MKREIKFRGWDAESKCMWFSDSNNGQEYCKLIIEEGAEPYFEYGVYRPYLFDGEWIDKIDTDTLELEHLMQFTGLKDKNGKEIYEGDIVRFVTNTTYPHFCTTQLPITFNPSQGWHPYLQGIGQYEKWLPNLSEIIGNIYETPELIKSPETLLP